MLKRIPSQNLRVGMFVVEYGDGSFDRPHVRLGRQLESPADVEAVRRESKEAMVDTALSRIVPDASPSEPEGLSSIPPFLPRGTLGPEPMISLAEELRVARKVYNNSLDFMSRFLRDVKLGRGASVAEAEQLAGEIGSSAARNHKAASSISITRSHGYVTNHSVNVAFLAAALGVRLSLPESHLRTLTLAALLHDVGKALLPDAVLNKPGKLTPEEYALIKRHTQAGRELLAGQHLFSRDVLDAVLDHHESCDGTGYPNGKMGHEINPFANYLSILDVYDALISYRTYRRALTPFQALKFLYANRETRFSAPHLAAFIRFIGIYPVGSFVRLADGCYGLVTDFHEDRPEAPRVKVVFDKRLRPMRPVTVDTAQGNGGARVVELGLHPKDYHLNTELFFP
ncbi:HD domain-containing protein [Desulfovibrio aminophilus]|nr:HD domain-containing phosphohydrolase [Desulfovibrio aminophilus]MCM0756344.1 HD domain-containing protein [Desulfovibrio aminophilus]